MKKFTNLLALLLALVMVVSLFAGCTPTEEPNGTQDSTQGQEGIQQSAGSPAINNDMFPLKKPVTFRIAVRGQKEYQSLIERCEWYKYLNEKTNVTIKCIVLGEDHMETLETLISNNSTPDAILGPDALSSSDILDFAAKDQLHSLEKWVNDPKIMPNFQKALASVSGALNKMTGDDGRIWSLLGLSESSGTAWESPLTVNIEWLKQVPGYQDGKTFPKTIEEFTTVLRYFKEHDMNGNGDPNDEIPLLMVSSSDAGDGQGTLQGLMNLWGLGTTDTTDRYYVHIQDDGVCTTAPQTQNYRDCLTQINAWWQEGLIWNKFFDNVSAEEFAEVAGAETASWGFYNGKTWFNNGAEDNGSLAWRDAQTLVVPFDTGYETCYSLNPAVKGNLNTFTVFKACKNPDILMAWMDQFFSLAGSRSAESGLPNEWTLWGDAATYKDYYTSNPTWYIDTDGSLKYPSAENASWVDLNTYDEALAVKQSVNHPLWNDIFELGDIFKCITPEMYMNGQWESNQNSEAYVLGKFMEEHPEMFDHYIWPDARTSEGEKSELDFLWASVKAICTRYEKAFITGELRLNDTNWNNFQKELELAGIQDLAANMQTIWNRYSA